MVESALRRAVLYTRSTMIAHVSFPEVARMLIAGATFLPFAVLLGLGLSRFGVTARDSEGALRRGPCAVIALCFGILIFAHAMAIWFLAPSAFHPAMSAFYGVGGVIATTTTRARSTASAAQPRT